MSDTRFHEMPDGRRIAFRHTPGAAPTLVFLPGYMSDMQGSKANALFAQAQAQGRACLLLDYSGCGASSGDFAQGTLSRWREEVLALIEAHAQGP
ncbi:MAG: alpha/beta hydrolase, partial [Erythrobacter sp.]|nr:alpha/beta hydrolase [Erythrobacter sp.]